MAGPTEKHARSGVERGESGVERGESGAVRRENGEGGVSGERAPRGGTEME